MLLLHVLVNRNVGNFNHTANNSWWFLSTFLVKQCASGTFCLHYQYISNAQTVSWALDLKDYWYKEDSANRDQTPIKCLGISNNFFMVSNGKKPWYICQKKRCCSHNLLVVSTVTNSSEICNVSYRIRCSLSLRLRSL